MSLPQDAPTIERLPVGTWFYTWAGEDVYHLWQETENGSKRCGIIYNHPSVDFICERLNTNLAQLPDGRLATPS